MLVDLLIPAVMVFFGLRFEKKTPKPARSMFSFGYRTVMSMKSKETWDFAHKTVGKLYVIMGIILAVLSIVVLMFTIGKDKDTIGFTGMIICYVQIVGMLLPCIPTELALRRNFDKNGKRKN